MQMKRDTAALMAHLKLHNTAQSKLDLLGEMIAAKPEISAAELRDAMDKAEINPATKECANAWLAQQSTAFLGGSVAPKTEPKAPTVTKPKASKPKAPKPTEAAPSTADPVGSD